MATDAERARAVRRLVRACPTASLATLLADGGGRPYASLVLVACDHDAAPLLLLSDLAVHTRALAEDGRAALLFDGTAGLDDPLTGARVTLIGRVSQSGEARHRARFVARHPSAEAYAGFADFNVYRLAPERAHLVAGFGEVHWLPAEDLVFPADRDGPLMDSEADIVAHVNADHREAIARFASALLGLHAHADGWRMTGIDPEGVDLRARGQVARLDFPRPVHDAESARAALTALTGKARRAAAGGPAKRA